MNDILKGFILLGEREGREHYSKELLSGLAVLGNQTAMAIENAELWRNEKDILEKIGLEDRQRGLDHMASSMAHEIDNPMAIILLGAEEIQGMSETGRIMIPDIAKKDFDSALNQILEARKRVSAMIREIKNYARKTSGTLKPLTMKEVDEGFWLLIGHEFKKHNKVKFRREVAEKLPPFLGDKVQMEEVLINFANNSLHAVSNAEVKDVACRIFKKNADWLRIEFSDTGHGIPENMLEDIFLPSVTTKASTVGWGLGLFRVRKIVQWHNGKVWAESAGEGKGAKFIVEIPIFKGSVEEFRKQNPEPENLKKLF
jgi:signal transduction histidine kinase